MLRFSRNDELDKAADRNVCGLIRLFALKKEAAASAAHLIKFLHNFIIMNNTCKQIYTANPEDESMEQRKILGYARVSTREQNEDRQIIALMEMGVPENNIYVDRQSGKDFERPQYKKMLKKLSSDTVLFVKSIDRLGRNYADLNEQWRIITKDKGADIVVIDMPLLDTRQEKNLIGTLIGDIVLALLSYVAENERSNIKQRQAEGIAAAKKRGVKFGRPTKPLPDNFSENYGKWREGEISLSEAARECGMPASTFKNKAAKYKKA